MPESQKFTQLLCSLSDGDTSVLEQLTPIIVDELHRLARYHMKNENPAHTLQATALVNEAYLKLINVDNIDWKSRLHFYAVASRQMRQILVDHARRKAASKRGGDLLRVELDDSVEFNSENISELLYLDQLLSQLEQFDARAARMFQSRLFSGLSNVEIADLENLSVATVEREIRVAKAWLKNELRLD